MCPRTSARFACLTVVGLWVLALVLPGAALADGGPILSDPQLWALLKEGQQTAVVRLGAENTADVDLFISMLDESGQSHEVVFFVPLGAKASRFRAVEETSRQFDEAVTGELDAVLRQEVERKAAYKTSVRGSLLLGTLFINGAWSWPVWLAWLLSGCSVAGTPAPLETFETESSQIAIYGTDADTDLQALIRTTGLDPSVQETLSRLRGQQIAIVTLQTQPMPKGGSPQGGPTGQPGLHLSWTTTLVPHSSGARYSYPLGTGSAWAHPIELTRVYVAAVPGIDFVAEYPRLGADLSGYTAGGWSSRSRPRILHPPPLPEPGTAYAVDEAVGDFGHVWRVTYRQSNSSEDVAITRLPETSEKTRASLRRQQSERVLSALSWVFAPALAFAIWLLVWRYVMRRWLKVDYRWREGRLWREAFGWALLYPVTNSVVLAAGAVLTAVTAGVGLFVALPTLLLTALGVVSIVLFSSRRAEVLGIPRRRAALAYVLAVLIANAIYLPFGAAYLFLLGA